MSLELLHESVKVRADFASGRVTPLLFRRGDRVYKVERVNGAWEDRDGRHRNFWFAVTADTGDVFRLCLKTGDMVWWLESVALP